jgi:GNAT superfamily N-acetyltransferase
MPQSVTAFPSFSNGLRVVPTRPEHADALAALQVAVYPTLRDDERFKAAHYVRHVALFPEGQFLALDGERVVAMATTLRLHFDFDHVDHTFGDIIAGGWLTAHDPTGPWLYGADIGTHPDYRGRGIARALYAARQATVRRLRLQGQVTVGMLSGYGALQGAMTAEDYYAELLAGMRKDPTVSAQLHIGFQARGLLHGYLHDPVCADCGVLLVLPADRLVPFPA